ncbi:hypothetical protein MJO10_29115, partial [Salmonella enterica subsp. enterica serovar Anatum]|nr:hypothetical protein [Salmonella enterica subsp. enterica serovar Anatum]
KVCPGLDVIISCDNYHFLYDLGWELYGIAFLFFTALMLTCAAFSSAHADSRQPFCH